MDVQAVSQKLLQQVHCHRQEKEENRDGFLCRNLNGTSGRVPNDAATWKEFWENETGRKFGTCSCKDCTSRAEVGAHVQKSDSTDHKWYIVPLCKADNNKASLEHFEVKAADLVPVNE